MKPRLGAASSNKQGFYFSADSLVRMSGTCKQDETLVKTPGQQGDLFHDHFQCSQIFPMNPTFPRLKLANHPFGHRFT